MLKYLRIAVTALSLTACVLLIALWVRSYWWVDSLSGQYRSRAYEFTSSHGQLTLYTSRDSGKPEWRIGKYPAPKLRRPLRVGRRDSTSYTGNHVLALLVPHCLVVGIFGVTAVAVWLPRFRRFSIRTLLIATTLVAAALGIVVAFS